MEGVIRVSKTLSEFDEGQTKEKVWFRPDSSPSKQSAKYTMTQDQIKVEPIFYARIQKPIDANLQSFSIKLNQYTVKDLDKDAKKIDITFDAYLNELVTFTTGSGYYLVKEHVMDKAKLKKKIRDAIK